MISNGNAKPLPSRQRPPQSCGDGKILLPPSCDTHTGTDVDPRERHRSIVRPRAERRHRDLHPCHSNFLLALAFSSLITLARMAYLSPQDGRWWRATASSRAAVEPTGSVSPAPVPAPTNNVLITGGAGFIGMHLALRLRRTLGHGRNVVVAYDNLNGDYYSPDLKSERVRRLAAQGIPFVRGDVCDADALIRTLDRHDVQVVVHLAAQSSSRHDGTIIKPRPFRYPSDNEDCFVTLLDVLKERKQRRRQNKIVYASSASGYRFDLSVPGARASDEVVDPSIGRPHSHHRGIGHNERCWRGRTKQPVRSPQLASVSDSGPCTDRGVGRPDMTYHDMATRVAAPNTRLLNTTSVPSAYERAHHPRPRRSWMYVDDVVDGIVRALNGQTDGAEIVTLRAGGSGDPASDEEVLELMRRALVASSQEGKKNSIDAAPSKCWERGPSSRVNDAPTSLRDGISCFVRWFLDAEAIKFATLQDDGEKARSPPVIRPPPRNGGETRDDPPSELCFMSASFGETPQHVDPIPSITGHKHPPPFRYFMLTNLPELPCNGWERVVVDDLPLRRFISRSRWPKFMGWQHPLFLENCSTIFYTDADNQPRDLPPEFWHRLSSHVHDSEFGILQDLKPGNGTVLGELEGIVRHRKDIPRNVDASRRWFLEEAPNFNDSARGYWNHALVIDPSNEKYRELVTTFWVHYSAEEQSWRDQPLYRYVADLLGISPHRFPDGMGYRDFLKPQKHKPHHYSERDDKV